MPIEDALAYARKPKLDALLAARGGSIEMELYENGHAVDEPHALYSGTKSFWGVAAIIAERDGIIKLDEPVANALPQWNEDAVKSTITPRMLLQLTAGFGFGGLGNAVPTYERALETPLKTVPGSTFTYGGIPLQIFGAYFAEKLKALELTPQQYLEQRVLTEASTSIARWRVLKDGTQPLPTGAYLTARNWLAYGVYVLARHAHFAEAFLASHANPRYGLGWWLGAPGVSTDLVYASGSGGQGLYVIPSQKLVVVHFGNSTSYKHDAFLKRLLA